MPTRRLALGLATASLLGLGGCSLPRGPIPWESVLPRSLRPAQDCCATDQCQGDQCQGEPCRRHWFHRWQHPVEVREVGPPVAKFHPVPTYPALHPPRPNAALEPAGHSDSPPDVAFELRPEAHDSRKHDSRDGRPGLSGPSLADPPAILPNLDRSGSADAT